LVVSFKISNSHAPLVILPFKAWQSPFVLNIAAKREMTDKSENLQKKIIDKRGNM